MSDELIDEEESSAVTDMPSLWAKLDRRTRRMIQGQEDTHEELGGLKLEVAQTNARLEAQGERVTGLEKTLRDGHMCHRSDDFKEMRQSSRDVLEAIKGLTADAASTQGVAERASKDVSDLTGELKNSAAQMREAEVSRAKEMRGARRTTVGTAVGALLVLVLAALSAVWYIGQLDERDKQQNTQQDAATKAIKTQVSNLETKVNELPTSEQITSLTTEVRKATSQPAGPDHDGWFFVMTQTSQRRFCREQSRRQLALLPPSVQSACRALR